MTTVERVERTAEEAEGILEGIIYQIRANTRRSVGYDRPDLWEEAEQEGRIAAWTRLLEGYPISIATFKARQAAIDVARGSRTTGSKSYGGHVDSHRRSTPFQRKDGNGEEFTVEPRDTATPAQIVAYDARDELRGAMSALGERDREIVYAVFFDGLTSDEVGEQFGMTGSGVRWILKRSYSKMREALA